MASTNSTASTIMPVVDPFARNKVQIGFEVFFAVLICLVSMLGNSLVVFVNIKNSRLKNITNVFIHNLAWTDICVAALVMPFWIISLYNGRWIFNTELCEWTATTAISCGSASMWTMGVIAVNRYLKVVKPNIYPKFFPSVRIARVYCICVWFLSVLSSTLPLYGWGQYVYHARCAVCNLAWETESMAKAIVFGSVKFGAILSVIVSCYYKIYRTVKASSTNLSSHAAQNCMQDITPNSTSQTTDTNLLKTTFTVVCVFVMCYTPASVIVLCEVIFGPPPRLSSTMMMYLVFCSSAINPFIYGLMNPQLKSALAKVLRCKKSEQENQMTGLQNSRRTPATHQASVVRPMS